MTRQQQHTDLDRHFRDVLSPKRVRAFAREVGFVRRRGKINPFTLVWSLALGFTRGRTRTVSSLRRAYEWAAGTRLVPSSFYDRFNDRLVALLQKVAAHLLKTTVAPVLRTGGALGRFEDVMIADATVIRLRQLLARQFPACRTNHTKAAAKLHVVMSATRVSSKTVSITGERANDRSVLRIGPWVRDRLLLLDLGYFG